MKPATTPKRTRRTSREAAALQQSIAVLKAQGCRAKEIAAKLQIKLTTVNWYFDLRCKTGPLHS